MSHRLRLPTADIWPNPWSMHQTLRDHDPVHHFIPANQPEDDYYVLSRHADVWSTTRDHTTFSSAQGCTINYSDTELIGLQDNSPMVMKDEGIYTRFRKLVSHGFTPRQVNAVEPKVRDFVVERIEQLRAKSSLDIITEFFKPLPSIVMAHYVGFPEKTGHNSIAGSRPSWRPTQPTPAASPTRWTLPAMRSSRC